MLCFVCGAEPGTALKLSDVLLHSERRSAAWLKSTSTPVQSKLLLSRPCLPPGWDNNERHDPRLLIHILTNNVPRVHGPDLGILRKHCSRLHSLDDTCWSGFPHPLVVSVASWTVFKVSVLVSFPVAVRNPD